MIPLRKFLSLPPPVRERKLWRLLHDFESALRQADGPSIREFRTFFAGLTGIIEWGDLDPADWESSAEDSLLRSVNGLRHLVAGRIGREAAEWDLFPPQMEAAAPGAVPGLRRLVYCDDIRSPFNAGSIFRTAAAFGMAGVILSPACPDPIHPRFARSAMGACEWIPWRRLAIGGAVGLAELARSEDLPVFALELGGAKLDEFIFPREGVVVLGSEELGVKPELIDYCRQSGGVVSIDLPGPKASLNVGVSFGVLANAWVTAGF